MGNKPVVELPPAAWLRIMLWLPPRQMFRARRVCMNALLATQLPGFYDSRLIRDFGLHGNDPITQYRELVKRMYASKELRYITDLSFAVKNDKILLPSVHATNTALMRDHVKFLNRLSYRGKPPLVFRERRHYIVHEICIRCASRNITKNTDSESGSTSVYCGTCGHTRNDYNIELEYTNWYTVKVKRPSGRQRVFGCW